LFHIISCSSNIFLNFVHFAALNLREILGDVGFGSTARGISKVNGLYPLNAPSVGYVSTFDINERSG